MTPLDPAAPLDALGPFALLILAALVAGWVDAVVGGGGLIQLPALLLGFPSAAPAQILATNKLDDEFDSSAAIVGGELLLRGNKNLYCIAAP